MNFATLAGSTVGAVALMILFGIPPLVARARTPAMAAEAFAGLFRSLIFSAILIVAAPIYQKIYDDYGAALPFATESLLKANRHTAVIWLWLPLCLLVFAGETLAFIGSTASQNVESLRVAFRSARRLRA